MPSLFSDSEKIELASLLTDVADTFERPLIVYKSPNRVFLYENENDFSRFVANNQNLITSEQNEFVKHEIPARILYSKRLKEELLKPYVGGAFDEGQLKLEAEKADVRIKIKAEYLDVFKDVKEVELDNNRFKVDGPKRPHGLFTNDFYTFYLKLNS
jgi:hypothetical protein